MLLAAEIVVLDQWSKALAKDTALRIPYPAEITPYFNIVLTGNRGISFGMFRSMQEWMPMVLTGVTSCVVLALLVWMVRTNNKKIVFALATVIGGAVGNIIDRVRFGAVTDFLDFHYAGYHWPAFNLADSAIFVGVVLLAFDSIVQPHRTEQNRKQPHDQSS